MSTTLFRRPAPVRSALPNRRVSYTHKMKFRDDDRRSFFLTLGYDEDGRPKDVFADGWREGSDLQNIIRDACVIFSIAIQHGVPPEAFSASMARVPVWTPDGMSETWASELGVMVEEFAKADAAAQRGELPALPEP